MISRLRPVAATACRKASSSNAFIDVRSIGSIPSSSARTDGSVGPLKPIFTPTVDKTIGTPYALAVLASSRTCSSTRSVGVSDRMTSNISFWKSISTRAQSSAFQTPRSLVTGDLLCFCSHGSFRMVAAEVKGLHQIPVICGALAAEQPHLPCPPHCRRTILRLEFRVDVTYVGVHCVHRDRQLAGDLRPGQVRREIPQHPQLARAELLRRRLTAGS